jgi:hypothetical protein
VHQDYYELYIRILNTRCAVKFDSWWKCDMVYHDERDRFDRNAEFKDHKAYPCYKEFYES